MTDTTKQSRLPGETHIGRVALRVSNLSEVTAFYRDVVGLSIIDRSTENAVLGIDGGTDTQLLLLNQKSEAPPRKRTETGLFHTAFRVPSRGALGDALQRIRSRWSLDGASDHRVSEALYLTDPEGNGVEIYRDFPREDWPVGDEGTIQMTTEYLDLSSIEAAAVGNEHVPAGTSIGHVHLEVSSLDGFEDFYVNTAGFELQTSMADARFVGAGGYHHHIGANTWNGRTKPGDGRGLDWVEVVLPTTTDLDRVRERVTGNDYPFVESENGEGGFTVHDADGIEIRFATNGLQ